MNLEEWLKKNNPNDGPKWYSFNYQKYKRDTLNDEKRYKEFAVKKLEEIVEETIINEFKKCLYSDPYTYNYNSKILHESSPCDFGYIFEDERPIPLNNKYIVDDLFIKNLIEKIKHRM